MPSKPGRRGRDDRPPGAARVYKIELVSSAVKELSALPEADRRRVGRRISGLAATPKPPGVEKLKGRDDLYRVRAGDYRIVYTIRDAVLLVLVVRIGHRRDVYRGL